MGRLPGAEPILQAAARWRDRCLIEDLSVLSEERLWTPQNLAELDKFYVKNLDFGSGDFFTKLEAQLGPAPPQAKKLAAEMFWVMYLIVSQSAIGAETKRFQIRNVWCWSGEEMAEDHPLLSALLEQGISHPGTAYNTLRWKELLFFITMMVDWKQLTRTRRIELLDSPWAFAAWLDAHEHAAGRQFRHILLFLLFPEQFERMATFSHKQKVVKEFRKQWGEDPADINYADRVAVDREVLRVREKLASSLSEDPQSIDFYRGNIRAQWQPAPAINPDGDVVTSWPNEAEAEAWLQSKFGDHRIWLVATGGGGRLWRDFRENGIIALDFQSLGDLAEFTSRQEVHSAIAEKEDRKNPLNDSLAAWQFARDMTIGDIIIPKQGRSRLFGWGIVTGEYTYDPERSEYQHIRSVEWKTTGQWELEGDQKGISTKTLTEFRQYPAWTRWALELMGGGAAGKSTLKTSVTYSHRQALEGLFLEPEEFTAIVDSLGRRRNVILQGPPGVGKTFMARRLAYALIGRKEPERLQLVQFHQSYSYEDFVQGWRPNERGGFVLQDGVFHQFCSRAAQDSAGQPYVFIIDEINRGNLSRIFGELMMLIENDKRGPDYAIPLTYSGGQTFFVPDNVHVVGLMNTADRSLAMVDYALRRRFGFFDLQPAFGKERFSDYLLQQDVPSDIVARISNRMGALNEAIRADRRNLGPGFEVGHSYFVPTTDEENRDDTWYRAVIETEIAPLMREYWFDQPARADEHLGHLLE